MRASQCRSTLLLRRLKLVRHRHRSNSARKRKPSLSYATTFDEKWNLPILTHHPSPPSSPSPLASHMTNDKGTTHYPQDPILLICGWGGCGTVDWGAMPSMLAHRTQRPVITYDPRGLGNSSRVTSNSKEFTDTYTDDEHLDMSMDLMASDALSVAKQYFNSKKITRTTNMTDHNSNTPRRLSIGGVSMGGMVAQSLAAKLQSAGVDSCEKDNEYQCQISSLAIICSSPLYHPTERMTASVTELGGKLSNHSHHTDSLTNAQNLSQDHFLFSFDDWRDDCDESKLRNCRRFFDALGHDFLEQPGRKALRDKLIQSFISSRKDFVNGLGLNMILAQRKVILNECVGLLDVDVGPDNIDIDTYLHQGNGAGKRWNDAPMFLEGLNIPLMVIHGRDDSVIPFIHGERLHRAVARGPNGDGSHFVPIDDCDHLCWITHGHELVDALGDFLSVS